MNLFSKRRLLLVLPILAGAALAWLFFRPDPREAFLKQAGELLELANTRRHPEAAEWFSPDAVVYFEDSTGLTLKQLLALAKRFDEQENRIYRAGNLDVFHAYDYAELRVQRSDAGGTFSDGSGFGVPFLYQEGRWKIAAGFRGEKIWNYPGM